MAFDVETITARGAIAIASATLNDKLIIDGCDAMSAAISKADAVNVSSRPASPGDTTTDITGGGSTDNHIYAYANFVQGVCTGGDFRSFYLYGHLQSAPSTVFVIAIASAATPMHLPVTGEVINRTEIQFELTFSVADGVVEVASTSMYTTRGEFLLLKDRTVTTHAEGEPTTGENQTVYGVKTFNDGIKTNQIDPLVSGQDINVGGDVIPVNYYHRIPGTQNYVGDSLGDEDKKWRYVYCDDVKSWSVHTNIIYPNNDDNEVAISNANLIVHYVDIIGYDSASYLHYAPTGIAGFVGYNSYSVPQTGVAFVHQENSNAGTEMVATDVVSINEYTVNNVIKYSLSRLRLSQDYDSSRGGTDSTKNREGFELATYHDITSLNSLSGSTASITARWVTSFSDYDLNLKSYQVSIGHCDSIELNSAEFYINAGYTEFYIDSVLLYTNGVNIQVDGTNPFYLSNDGDDISISVNDANINITTTGDSEVNITGQVGVYIVSPTGNVYICANDSDANVVIDDNIRLKGNIVEIDGVDRMGTMFFDGSAGYASQSVDFWEDQTDSYSRMSASCQKQIGTADVYSGARLVLMQKNDDSYGSTALEQARECFSLEAVHGGSSVPWHDADGSYPMYIRGEFDGQGYYGVTIKADYLNLIGGLGNTRIEEDATVINFGANVEIQSDCEFTQYVYFANRLGGVLQSLYGNFAGGLYTITIILRINTVQQSGTINFPRGTEVYKGKTFNESGKWTTTIETIKSDSNNDEPASHEFCLIQGAQGQISSSGAGNTILILRPVQLYNNASGGTSPDYYYYSADLLALRIA